MTPEVVGSNSAPVKIHISSNMLAVRVGHSISGNPEIKYNPKLGISDNRKKHMFPKQNSVTGMDFFLNPGLSREYIN